MTMRLALLSLLLAPLMACSPGAPADNATPAAADAPAADTAPAAEGAPADAAPAADAAAAAPDTETPAAAPAAAAAPVGPAPVAGKDYVEIANGQPFEPKNGKVEVVEVFGFVCPACARFQPDVSAWKATLPADVRFTYVPAMFGGTWDNYARAYYAAESMGIESKTHDAVYKAIHIDQALKGERGQDSVEDIAAFYAKAGGVDAKQFASTMASFAVSAKTNKAKAFALRAQIQGTPTLVVDGKYQVKGESYADMLRIADQLIAQSRTAPAAP